MIYRRLEGISLRLIFWIIIAIFTLPILWFVLTSLKTRVDAFSIPPKWIFTPTLDNYRKVFSNGTFIQFYLNSLKIGFLSTFFSILIGVPAAYALARFNIKKKDDIAFWILSSRMAPPVMVILPLYLLFRRLNMLDSMFSMILLYMLFGLAFVVWMMKSFFESIPEDLEDAARIDACSRLGAFWRVTLPLSAPGIITSSIFSFIMAWNEFLYALIMTGDKTKTVTVAITGFINFEGIRWGEIASAGTLTILPVLIFGMLIQKYFIEGMTMGSVK